MKFVVRLREGERMPWSHRAAWYDWPMRQQVCWPLGLHFIARMVRWCWARSFVWFRRRDAWDRVCAAMEWRYDERYSDQITVKNRVLRESLELVEHVLRASEGEGDEAMDAKLRELCDRIRGAIQGSTP